LKVGTLVESHDGADMLAGERAGQVAGDEAVYNLHLADVIRTAALGRTPSERR
jgi:hypothetical protein